MSLWLIITVDLIYERNNLLDEAIREFSRAISLDPTRRIFYKDRGKAYVFNKSLQMAEMDYSKALELDPSDSEMWFRRSLCGFPRTILKGV